MCVPWEKLDVRMLPGNVHQFAKICPRLSSQHILRRIHKAFYFLFFFFARDVLPLASWLRKCVRSRRRPAPVVAQEPLCEFDPSYAFLSPTLGMLSTLYLQWGPSGCSRVASKASVSEALVIKTGQAPIWGQPQEVLSGEKRSLYGFWSSDTMPPLAGSHLAVRK